jgi:CRP-like cAMP-binding protein
MTIPSPSDLSTLKAPLIAKLSRFVELAACERAHLEEIQADFVKVRPGTDIITAGHAYRHVCVLNRGMAIRYKVLHDGRRQVLSLVLPGDFVGLPGCLFDSCLYSIASLTEVVSCSIPFATLFDLFQRYPRLGTAMFWLAGHEAALYAEHLVRVGRQSAYERVAHLLLELLFRLQIAGCAADDHSYALPMTQELMADALGLSVPHVNRTLRRLREDGLIAVEGTRLICLDVAALARVSDFDRANLGRLRIPGL